MMELRGSNTAIFEAKARKLNDVILKTDFKCDIDAIRDKLNETGLVLDKNKIYEFTIPATTHRGHYAVESKYYIGYIGDMVAIGLRLEYETIWAERKS